MDESELTPLPERLRSRESRRPERAHRVRRVQGVALVVAAAMAVVRHGLDEVSTTLAWELGLLVVLCLLADAVGHALLLHWTRSRGEHLRTHAFELGILGLWLPGCIVVPLAFDVPDGLTSASGLFRWSELAAGMLAVLYAIDATRRVASGGQNPGFLLAGSFLLLITIGTTLLMLPRARADSAIEELSFAESFRVSLFTATSASCVTGLIVVPTGSYWSHFGHVVIFCLFQIGGLGIMTCGAFFAAAMGSRLAFRETATLGNMLEAESAKSLRSLLRVILVATFAIELVGAMALTTMWPREWPLERRLWWGLFHAVSAFCNAGFSLRDEGFLGWGTRWQIALVVPALIVVGGIGFQVTYNVWLWLRTRLAGSAPHSTPLFHFPKERVRLTLASKLVLLATGALLVVGTFGFYVLEALGPRESPFLERWCDAWFQSVTFRTAGFNTVDHALLQPATKLFAILLMFIGASPGSTGGGIKTVTFAIAVLAIASALRGHDRVDVWNRTIPARQVNRALVIMALGLACLTATAMLLVVFEPLDEHGFLDLLYEATSAFATVGVSTGLTGELRPPSQYVLAATMYLGRIGPLTLLIGLAGRRGDVRYRYPEEAVPLG